MKGVFPWHIQQILRPEGGTVDERPYDRPDRGGDRPHNSGGRGGSDQDIKQGRGCSGQSVEL